MISLSQAEPWYYYGGPGYYHGFYSSGFYQYPSYLYNDRKKRSPQQHVTRDDQIRNLAQVNDDLTYYVALVNPYKARTHYGYPHYYSYGHPIHLSYTGGNRQKRQVYNYGRRYGGGSRSSGSKGEVGPAVGNYYGPYGYYGSPWWAGYGRWGYYAKPGQSGTQPYSYSQ